MTTLAHPRFSADGRYVALGSDSANLAAGNRLDRAEVSCCAVAVVAFFAAAVHMLLGVFRDPADRVVKWLVVG